MILAAIVFGIWLVASLASGSLRTPESRRKMARDGAIVLAVIAAIVVVSSLGEGQLDVPNIAATLKVWAQPFPVSDDWMDTRF
ncbi:hypothetical protein QRB32_09425 [Mycobacterium intracellulare subsp. chimaera]|uniref:hypothetical protein n=1 Tax=Mycobacterium intracellulare TaxID=1767 RepID=UPI00259B5071|nr:hypothetical protein [Mycobacterium intracellulare]MDM3932419.1 hypothetical protein [Mycobacterium intracellulare subsp. chimaera]